MNSLRAKTPPTGTASTKPEQRCLLRKLWPICCAIFWPGWLAATYAQYWIRRRLPKRKMGARQREAAVAAAAAADTAESSSPDTSKFHRSDWLFWFLLFLSVSAVCFRYYLKSFNPDPLFDKSKITLIYYLVGEKAYGLHMGFWAAAGASFFYFYLRRTLTIDSSLHPTSSWTDYILYKAIALPSFVYVLTLIIILVSVPILSANLAVLCDAILGLIANILLFPFYFCAAGLLAAYDPVARSSALESTPLAAEVAALFRSVFASIPELLGNCSPMHSYFIMGCTIVFTIVLQ